jgi:hypothetical protein
MRFRSNAVVVSKGISPITVNDWVVFLVIGVPPGVHVVTSVESLQVRPGVKCIGKTSIAVWSSLRIELKNGLQSLFAS